MPSPPSERRRIASAAAVNASWARTPDRAARTAPARQAFADRFAHEADPDEARRAYFADLAARSHEARRGAKSAGSKRPTADGAADGP